MNISITVNKLAEFIIATPQRKKTIVRQLIRQELKGKDFPTYYGTFRKTARDYLISNCQNDKIVYDAINILDSRNETTWKTRDSQLTKEALLSFQSLKQQIQNLDLEFCRLPKNCHNKLVFGDVTVKLRPDLIVKRKRNGIPVFGALRYYIAKESKYELGQKGAEYVAAMQYLWAIQNSTGKIAPDISSCIVLECFQKRITLAPLETEIFLERIKKGCELFEFMWNLEMNNEAA